MSYIEIILVNQTAVGLMELSVIETKHIIVFHMLVVVSELIAK